MQENEPNDQTDVNLDGPRGVGDDIQKDPATQQVSSAEERELSAIESESADQQDPDESVLEQQVDVNSHVVASQKKSHKGLVVGVVLVIIALAAGATYIVLPK